MVSDEEEDGFCGDDKDDEEDWEEDDASVL